jgi:hypothetical protein
MPHRRFGSDGDGSRDEGGPDDATARGTATAGACSRPAATSAARTRPGGTADTDTTRARPRAGPPATEPADATAGHRRPGHHQAAGAITRRGRLVKARPGW